MVALNIMSRRCHLISGWIVRMGFVSRSSSFSNSISTPPSGTIRPLDARLSFQHIILARIAKSSGSMRLSTSRAWTAKNGSIFTINVVPRVQAVEELSRNNDSIRLLSRGRCVRTTAVFSNDGPQVNAFKSERSWSRVVGIWKCLSISSRRSLDRINQTIDHTCCFHRTSGRLFPKSTRISSRLRFQMLCFCLPSSLSSAHSVTSWTEASLNALCR